MPSSSASKESRSKSSTSGTWHFFPRDQPWYIDTVSASVEVVNASAEGSMATDALELPFLLLRLILSWLPQRRLGAAAELLDSANADSMDEDLNAFSFTAFASRIPGLLLSDQRQLDIVESVVLIVAADTLTLALSLPDIQSSTIASQLLTQICLALIRPAKPRALDGNLWHIIQGWVVDQWSCVLSQLANAAVVPAVIKFLSSPDLLKSSNDIQSASLAALRLRFNSTTYHAQPNELQNLLASFSLHWWPHALSRDATSSHGSHSVRVACFEVLSFWLLTMECTNLGPTVGDMLKGWYRQAEKILKSGPEELDESAMRLAAAILARADSAFREAHLDKFLSKTIARAVSAPKKRDFALETLLHLVWPKSSVVISPIFFVPADSSPISMKIARASPFDPLAEADDPLHGDVALPEWALHWNQKMRQAHGELQTSRRASDPDSSSGLATALGSVEEKLIARLNQIQLIVFAPKTSFSKAEASSFVELAAELIRVLFSATAA
jgi:hypothetical protein